MLWNIIQHRSIILFESIQSWGVVPWATRVFLVVLFTTWFTGLDRSGLVLELLEPYTFWHPYISWDILRPCGPMQHERVSHKLMPSAGSAKAAVSSSDAFATKRGTRGTKLTKNWQSSRRWFRTLKLLEGSERGIWLQVFKFLLIQSTNTPFLGTVASNLHQWGPRIDTLHHVICLESVNVNAKLHPK